MLPTSTLSALKLRIPVTVWLVAFFSVCALAQTASPQPRPSPEQEAIGASTIRGRVIYSDTSHPLRRAEVALISEVTGNWDEPVVTDRNGEFVFINVSAGKYFVVVSAADIVSPRSLLDDNLTLADQIALGQIESGFSEVTVDGRSSTKTEIRAARGGVITGRVLSEDDTPIPGAAIKLLQLREGGLVRVFATWAFLRSDKQMLETDSRGVYRIAGLASGEYIIRVSESSLGAEVDDGLEGNYAKGEMLVAYYPRALRVQDATSVKVQQGAETREIDIRLPDRSLHKLSGTVTLLGHAARDVGSKTEWRRTRVSV